MPVILVAASLVFGILGVYILRARRMKWNIGGVSLGMPRSRLTHLYGKLHFHGQACVGFPHECPLLRVEFDRSEEACTISGVRLVGPQGIFSKGQLVERLQERIGEPIYQRGMSFSRYMLSNVVLDVQHTPEEPKVIEVLTIGRLSNCSPYERHEMLRRCSNLEKHSFGFRGEWTDPF